MQESAYLVHGDTFRVVNSGQQSKVLPANFYIIQQDLSGFYLKSIPAFSNPKKIYGSVEKDVERFVSTFNDRPKNTGILLSGEKGSGKTLTARMTAQRMVKSGVPIILISEAYRGDAFNLFISSITQDLVLFFDEFEKTYDTKESQNAILSLLDGVYPGKRMFLMTVNESFDLVSPLKNRPGRIFYKLQFEGLTEDFIREFATDNLKDKSQVESLVRLSYLIPKINFDVLASIIEDMNRYQETAIQSLHYLNIDIHSHSDRYEIEGEYEGRKYSVYPKSYFCNPYDSGFERVFDFELAEPEQENKSEQENDSDSENEDNSWFGGIRFTYSDLVKSDFKEGIAVFENPEGFSVTLRKEVRSYSFESNGMHSFIENGDSVVRENRKKIVKGKKEEAKVVTKA